MTPPIVFRDAQTEDDVEAIMALQNTAADALTSKFGEGAWSSRLTLRGAANLLRHARVRLGVSNGRIVTTLRLATKKPWAIDVSYFTPVPRPLHLTGMAVLPEWQRQGLGRRALDDATDVAREWPGDAIRLDAYDADAGAGEFYTRCGFEPRGRVVYKGDPLTYHELLIGVSTEA